MSRVSTMRRTAGGLAGSSGSSGGSGCFAHAAASASTRCESKSHAGRVSSKLRLITLPSVRMMPVQESYRKETAMLWELEIWAKDHNPDRERVCSDYDLLTHSESGHEVITAVSRGYLLDADLTTEVDRVRLTDLLTDQLVEDVRLAHLNAETHDRPRTRCVTVLPKPGVMDPVAASVMAAARDALFAVR